MVFLGQENSQIYLVEEKEPPTRRCKHEFHIMKVIFLCTFTDTKYNIAGKLLFISRIGICPIVKKIIEYLQKFTLNQ